MNYLAIDTSSRALTVLARRGDTLVVDHTDDCALRHSVVLMERVDAALKRAGLTVSDCDFIACTVGPGSFTGIRIGISTVKGFCLAAEKPFVAVTTFDVIAYSVTVDDVLGVADAGKDCYYVCGYDRERKITFDGAYVTRAEAEALRSRYRLVSLEALPIETQVSDGAEGLRRAVEHAYRAGGRELSAVYLRRSQAEEQREKKRETH